MNLTEELRARGRMRDYKWKKRKKYEELRKRVRPRGGERQREGI